MLPSNRLNLPALLFKLLLQSDGGDGDTKSAKLLRVDASLTDRAARGLEQNTLHARCVHERPDVERRRLGVVDADADEVRSSDGLNFFFPKTCFANKVLALRAVEQQVALLQFRPVRKGRR